MVYYLNQHGHIVDEEGDYPFDVDRDRGPPFQPHSFETIQKANAWLADIGFADRVKAQPAFVVGQKVKLLRTFRGYLPDAGPYNFIEQPKGTVGTVSKATKKKGVTTYLVWIEPGVCCEHGIYSEFSNHNAPITAFLEGA